MANISVENKCGCLYFYSKKGLSQPCYLTPGKTSIGSSLQCHIRIKGVEDIFCILDSNDSGITVLVNTHEDERILLNGIYAQKYTVLTHDDHFQLGDKKFKYCKPDLNEKDLECIRKTVASRMLVGNFKRESKRKSTLVSPLKRLQRPSLRRFSTGSSITEVNYSQTVSGRNLSSGKTSTPQSASKTRFSQRLTRPRLSALGALKENEMLEFQNESAKFDSCPYGINKMFSKIEESSKTEFKTPTPKKKMSTSVNLKEVDLNSTVSSGCSPVPTRKKMYSGNLSDVSDFTTPENKLSALNITPLNVSKKTNRSLIINKSALDYADLQIESSTPKSAVRRRQSSAVYRPIVEEITPVSPVSRSSLRVSSLTKPSFTQRRSVNFNMSSSLDNSIVAYAKRKRSQSDISAQKKKIAKHNEKEIDIFSVKDSDDEIEDSDVSQREESTSRYERSITRTRTSSDDSSDSDDIRMSLTRKDISGRNYIDNFYFENLDSSNFGTYTNRNSSPSHKYRKSSVCSALDEAPETSRKSSRRLTMNSSFNDGTFEVLHDNRSHRTSRTDETNHLETSVGKNSLRSRGNVSLTPSISKTPRKSTGRKSAGTPRSEKLYSTQVVDSSFEVENNEEVASFDDGTFDALHVNRSHQTCQIDEIDPLEASVGENSQRSRGSVSLKLSISETPQKSIGRKSVGTPRSEKLDSTEAVDSSLDVQNEEVIASFDSGTFDSLHNNRSHITPQIDATKPLKASVGRNSLQSRGNISLTSSTSKTPKKSTGRKSVGTPRSEKLDYAEAVDSSFDVQNEEVNASSVDGRFDALLNNSSHRTLQVDEMDPLEASFDKNSLRNRGSVSFRQSASKTPKKSTGSKSVETPRSEKLDSAEAMDSTFEDNNDEVFASSDDGMFDASLNNSSHTTPQVDEIDPLEVSFGKKSLRTRGNVSLRPSISKKPQKSTGSKSVETPRSEKLDSAEAMDSTFEDKNDEVFASSDDGMFDASLNNSSHRNPQVDEMDPLEVSFGKKPLRTRGNVSLRPSISKTPQKSTGRKSDGTPRSEKLDLAETMDSSFKDKNVEVVASSDDDRFDASLKNRSHRTPQVDEVDPLDVSFGKKSLRTRGNVSLRTNISKTPQKSTGRKSVGTPRSEKFDLAETMDSSFKDKNVEVVASSDDGRFDASLKNRSHRTPQVDEVDPLEVSFGKKSLRTRANVSLRPSISKTPQKSNEIKSVRTPRSKKLDSAEAMDSSFEDENNEVVPSFDNGTFDTLHHKHSLRTPQTEETKSLEASVGRNSLRSQDNISLTLSTSKKPKKSTGRKSIRTPGIERQNAAGDNSREEAIFDFSVVSDNEKNTLPPNDSVKDEHSPSKTYDENDDNALSDSFCLNLSHSEVSTQSGRDSRRSSRISNSVLDDSLEVSLAGMKFARGSSTPMALNRSRASRRVSSAVTDVTSKRKRSNLRSKSMNSSSLIPRSVRITRKSFDSLSNSLLARGFKSRFSASVTEIVKSPMKPSRSSVVSSPSSEGSFSTRATVGSGKPSSERSSGNSSIEEGHISFDVIKQSTFNASKKISGIFEISEANTPVTNRKLSRTPNNIPFLDISRRTTSSSSKNHNLSVLASDKSLSGVPPENANNKSFSSFVSKSRDIAVGEGTSPAESSDISEQDCRVATPDASPAVSKSSRASNSIVYSFLDSSLDTCLTENFSRRSSRLTRPSIDERIYEIPKTILNLSSRKSNEKTIVDNKFRESPIVEGVDRIFNRTQPKDPTDITATEAIFCKFLETPNKTPKVHVSPKTEKRISVNVQNDPSDITGLRRLLKTPKTTTPLKNITSNVHSLEKLRLSARVQNSSRKDRSLIEGGQNDSPINALVSDAEAENILKMQKLPENNLSDRRGINKLLKTLKVQSSPKNDLTNVAGVKRLLRTPREQNSPRNDLTQIIGVKKLMATPKKQKSPKNDITNVSGVKNILRTPGISAMKLMNTPKIQNSPKNDLTNISGIERLLKTPKKHSSPKNNLTNKVDVKNLATTLKQQNSPKNDLSDVRGVKRLLTTPKVHTGSSDLNNFEISGIDKLFNESMDNTFDSLVDTKPPRTYGKSSKRLRQSDEHVPELKSPSDEISNKNNVQHLIDHGSSRSRKGQKQLYNSMVESVSMSDENVKEIEAPASSSIARSPSKNTPNKNDALESILLFESSRSKRGQRKLYGPIVELDSTSDAGVNATSTPVCADIHRDNKNEGNTYSDNNCSEIEPKRGRLEKGDNKRKVSDSPDKKLVKENTDTSELGIEKANRGSKDTANMKVHVTVISDDSAGNHSRTTTRKGRKKNEKSASDAIEIRDVSLDNSSRTRAKTRKVKGQNTEDISNVKIVDIKSMDTKTRNGKKINERKNVDETETDSEISKTEAITRRVKNETETSNVSPDNSLRTGKKTKRRKDIIQDNEEISTTDVGNKKLGAKTRMGEKELEKNTVEESETQYNISLETSSRSRTQTRRVKNIMQDSGKTSATGVEKVEAKPRKGNNEPEKNTVDETEKQNISLEKSSRTKTKARRARGIVQDNEDTSATDVEKLEFNTKRAKKEPLKNTVDETEKNTADETEKYNFSLENSSRIRAKTRRVKDIGQANEESSARDVEKVEAKTRRGRREPEKNTVDETKKKDISLEKSPQSKRKTRRVKDIDQETEETSATDVEKMEAKARKGKRKPEKNTVDETEKNNISLEITSRNKTKTRRILKDIVQDNEQTSATDVEKVEAKTRKGKKVPKKNTADETEKINISLEESSRTTRRMKDIVQDIEETSATDVEKVEARTRKGKKEPEKNAVDETEKINISLEKSSRTKPKTRRMKDIVQNNEETCATDAEKLETKTRRGKKKSEKNIVDETETYDVRLDQNSRTKTRGIKDTVQDNIETSVSKVETKKSGTKTRNNKKNIKETENDNIIQVISSDHKTETDSDTDVAKKKSTKTQRANKNSSIEDLKAEEGSLRAFTGRNTRANRGQNSKYDEIEWDTPVKTTKNKLKKNVTFHANAKSNTPVAVNNSPDGLRRSRRTRK